MRASSAVLGALVVTALATGCAGVRPPDLFIVQRSGPGGQLTLLVDEQGGLHCDGGRAPKLSDPQLIQARALQEELATPSAEHLSLAPRPGSVFSYRVHDEAGSVSFADNSSAQPKVLRNLALFVLQVAQQNCHLPSGR
ncbi:MAG TPA: hypothetical protein VGH60_09030 [Solirubrobacteraceae bacterium]|jgi:hypothetical protein